MQRPWQSPVPPVTTSVCEEVLFPTDQEEDGIVRVAWRGPQAQVRQEGGREGGMDRGRRWWNDE